MQAFDITDVMGEWEGAAACRRADSDLFFTAGTASELSAKAVCRECPVRWECLAYALRHRVEHGVWGGLSERERRKLLNRTRPSAWDRDTAMRSVS